MQDLIRNKERQQNDEKQSQPKPKANSGAVDRSGEASAAASLVAVAAFVAVAQEDRRSGEGHHVSCEGTGAEQRLGGVLKG